MPVETSFIESGMRFACDYCCFVAKDWIFIGSCMIENLCKRKLILMVHIYYLSVCGVLGILLVGLIFPTISAIR